MRRFLIATCVAAYGLSGSVLAEPATKAGAQELRDTLHRYLGGSTWAIQAVAVGDHYSVIVDPQALVESFSVEGFRASGSTVTLSMTDNGDGTWAYALDQPISLFYTLPFEQPIDVQFLADDLKLSGIFDESLGCPRSFRLEATKVYIDRSIANPDPRIRTITSSEKAQSWIVEGSAVAGTTGVDLSVHSIMDDTFVSLTVPQLGTDPWKAQGAIAQSNADFTATGLEARNIFDLWAGVIAFAGTGTNKPDRAGLKSLAEAALPLFADLAATSTLTGVSINTPQGVFGAKEVSLGGAVTGIVDTGRLHGGIEVKGLFVPDSLLPGPLSGLVPKDLSLGLTVTDFDLAGMADVFLTVLDQPVGSSPPAGYEEALKLSLLPTGKMTLTLDPGFATTPDYKLTYKGNMTVWPDREKPVFDVTLGLTGMTAIRAALQSAPSELNLGMAGMMLGALTGLAKPGAEGAQIWEISLDEAGMVLVNGFNPDKLFANP